MKKILIIIVLATALYAEETKFEFFGVSIASSTLKFNNSVSQKDATLGLRYGIQSTEWRTFIDASKDWRGFTAITLETDKIFTAFRVEDVNIAPYAGVSLGYIDHKLNDNKHSIYGVHGGLIVNLDKHLDLDIGLSHKRKRNQKNLDNLNAVTLSLHYFF